MSKDVDQWGNEQPKQYPSKKKPWLHQKAKIWLCFTDPKDIKISYAEGSPLGQLVTNPFQGMLKDGKWYDFDVKSVLKVKP